MMGVRPAAGSCPNGSLVSMWVGSEGEPVVLAPRSDWQGAGGGWRGPVVVLGQQSWPTVPGYSPSRTPGLGPRASRSGLPHPAWNLRALGSRVGGMEMRAPLCLGAGCVLSRGDPSRHPDLQGLLHLHLGGQGEEPDLKAPDCVPGLAGGRGKGPRPQAGARLLPGARARLCPTVCLSASGTQGLLPFPAWKAPCKAARRKGVTCSSCSPPGTLGPAHSL